MTASDVSAWLTATPLSQTIQSTVWAVPTLQSVHILAICVVAASAMIFDLRLVGALGREAAVTTVARRYLPWLWTALVVLLFTGLALVIGEPDRTLENWVFWTKMSLLAAAVVLTAAVQASLKRPERWEAGVPAPARLAGAVSLAIWIGVIVCGRWIAYVY